MFKKKIAEKGGNEETRGKMKNNRRKKVEVSKGTRRKV